MSKVSTPNYPSYTGSSVTIGDSEATTGILNGMLTSNYKMSDDEASIYDYALKTIINILPKVNTFDTNTKNSLKSQVDAYTNSGIKGINEYYTPIIKQLQNDIGSRFGNLDTSMFTDNLNNIESKRADAISAFAQDALARQSQLESDELTKRYALINLLSGIADNTYNNALNTLGLALGSSSNANNYNKAVYDALANIAGTNSRNNSNTLISSLLGLAGNPSSLFSLPL